MASRTAAGVAGCAIPFTRDLASCAIPLARATAIVARGTGKSFAVCKVGLHWY